MMTRLMSRSDIIIKGTIGFGFGSGPGASKPPKTLKPYNPRNNLKTLKPYKP